MSVKLSEIWTATPSFESIKLKNGREFFILLDSVQLNLFYTTFLAH